MSQDNNPSTNETTTKSTFCDPKKYFGWMEDRLAIRDEPDPYRRQAMYRQYEATYGPVDDSTKRWMRVSRF